MSDATLTRALFVAFGLALLAHVLVGLIDERRLSLQIVGPVSPIVGYLWVGTLIVAAAVLLIRKGRSVSAAVIAGVALLGIALIWYPHHP